MYRRNFFALAAVPLLGSVRAQAQETRAAAVTYGQSVGVLTLDPVHGAFTLYPAGYEAALCLYDGLLTFSPEMKIIPQLATGYTMSDDLKTCTLTLRDGAKFHDGTAVDAAAVKFNIERLMDKQRNPTNRPLWDPVAGVDTPGARTVVLHLSQPFATMPNSLAHPSGVLVSPAAVQKYGEAGIAKNPVGAGPFRMASFDPGQQLVMEAFDGYWGGKPKTAKLTLKTVGDASTRVAALRTGAADVIDSVPVALVG